MRIQGLQKLTLLDFPEKVACTVFTAGCNFRCPFCHNASLVVSIPKDADITEEKFFDFLKKKSRHFRRSLYYWWRTIIAAGY